MHWFSVQSELGTLRRPLFVMSQRNRLPYSLAFWWRGVYRLAVYGSARARSVGSESNPFLHFPHAANATSTKLHFVPLSFLTLASIKGLTRAADTFSRWDPREIVRWWRKRLLPCWEVLHFRWHGNLMQACSSSENGNRVYYNACTSPNLLVPNTFVWGKCSVSQNPILIRNIEK